jgi:uncharacterized protein with PQ loop repeat
MNISSILGVIGTLVGLSRALPQLLRLLQTRSASGVSVDSSATSSVVSFGWMAYGILSAQPFVILATGLSGIVYALISLAALRFGRTIGEIRVAPLWCVVLLLANLLAGKSGLGIVLAVGVLVANLPQVWVAYRETNLADLSLGTWLLCFIDGLVWGIYALLLDDLSIMAYSFFQLTTSGWIVAVKQLKRQG